MDILEANGQLLRNPSGPTMITEGRDGLRFPVFEEMWDIGKRIRRLEDLKIDLEIVSIGNPWLSYIPLEKAKTAAREVNRELADVVGDHRKQMVGIGVLPLTAPTDALEEMDFAIEELGLRGFMVGSHVGGRSIASEEFMPVFEHAARKEVPIYIHPLAPPNVSGYDLLSIVSFVFPMQTSVAAVSLALGGVFDMFPRLKVVLAHLGGTLPFCLGRLDRATQATPNAPKIPAEAHDYMRNFYLDSISYYQPTLEYAVDLWGL